MSMHDKLPGLTASLLFAASLAIASPAAGLQIRTYSQPEWTLGAVTGVNKAGQVVGIYDDGASARHGFLYENGTYREIGPAGWTGVWAWAIDRSGRIVGTGSDGVVDKAYLYSGGTYTTIIPPGWTRADARKLNESGLVVGSGTTGGLSRGYIYDSAAASYTVLDAPGSTDTMAFGVNDAGQVVGARAVGLASEAFSYLAGVYTNPAPPGWVNTLAVDVNNGGTILGMGTVAGMTRCFLNKGGIFSTILPPGYESSSCGDINNSGVVLGRASPSGGGSDWFVYHKGRYHILNLPTSTAELLSINDQNIIAGARLSGFVGFEAITIILYPEAAVTANGETGAVSVSSSAPLVLRITMDAALHRGRTCDWWVVAQTPTGPYSFDVASRRWLPGLRPAAVGPLRDLKNIKLPPVSNAPGLYTYYFGADGFANGRIDFAALVFDTVTVHIR